MTLRLFKLELCCEYLIFVGINLHLQLFIICLTRWQIMKTRVKVFIACSYH